MKTVSFTINPKVYPLETIYAAAYAFLDKVYVKLDGDPATEITVQLKHKTGGDAEQLKDEFMNELINYADYSGRAKKTLKLREMLMQRALLTNTAQAEETDTQLEDLEEVAIPWEDDPR